MAAVATSASEPQWVRASPLDVDGWKTRLKQELAALITLIKQDKGNGRSWFTLRPENEQGVKWKGTCKTFVQDVKYEFELEVTIPATYPSSPPEISLPQLREKSEKLYRGGHICLDIHFTPAWHQRKGAGGIAFALVQGLAPWLASEVPLMVERGLL